MSFLYNISNGILNRIGKQTYFLLILLIFLSFFMRFLSFHYSVIDVDESTYLIIGKEIFKGNLLYVDYYDTKPAGIFLLFGFLEYISGNGLLLSRIVAALLVAFTGYFLYLLKYRFTKNHLISALSGLIYVALVSSYRFGFAANTEVFFNFFIVLSLYLLFNSRRWHTFLVTGIIAGMGFIIKYVVLFDMLAFWTFMLVFGLKKKELQWIAYLGNGLLFILGLIIPLGLVALYYYSVGFLPEFTDSSVFFLQNYQSTYTTRDFILFILDIHIKFLPVVLMLYLCIYHKIKRINTEAQELFPIIWFFAGVLSVVLLRKPHLHYIIQLFLPVSFILPDFFKLKNSLNRMIMKHRLAIISYTSLLLLLINIINQSHYLVKPDYPRIIANKLKNNISANETIYVSNYKHIIYYFLDLSPPGKYVHPSLLINGYHIKSIGVKPSLEIKKIMAKKPAYIIYKDRPFLYDSERYFRESYKRIETYNNNIYIHKKTAPNNNH